MSQYEPLYDSFDRSVPERYVPTTRLSVSASVYLPGSEVDLYTGQIKPDHLRRRRTQGKRLDREQAERESRQTQEALQREMARGGVRISMRLGILLIAALLFVCGVFMLSWQGVIVNRQKEINGLETAIAKCRSENALLETQIAEASDAAVVCYAASQELNMIPAESAEAIYLVAVDTRPLEKEQRAADTGDMQILTAQGTHAPASASKMTLF